MSIFNLKVKNTDNSRVDMLIPPPVLLIMLSVLAGAIHWIKWQEFDSSPLRTFIGGAIILGGLLIMRACVRAFERENTPVRPDKIATTKIVTEGVYAYSRNPMYVGMALILFGLSIMLKGPAFFMAMAIFMMIIHFGVVLREERYLLQTHPQEYREYMRKVRRWL